MRTRSGTKAGQVHGTPTSQKFIGNVIGSDQTMIQRYSVNTQNPKLDS